MRVGRRRVVVAARRDQLVDALAAHAALRPGDHARAVAGHLARDLVELRVVDERRDVLARHDVAQLRRREAGVEQHGVGAELRRRDERLDEIAVVAREHAERAPGPHAAVGQSVRERVGAAVQLGVGDRAELVGQRRAVAMPRGAGGDAAGQRAPVVPLRGRHPQRGARRHRAQDARGGEHPRTLEGAGADHSP